MELAVACCTVTMKYNITAFKLAKRYRKYCGLHTCSGLIIACLSLKWADYEIMRADMLQGEFYMSIICFKCPTQITMYHCWLGRALFLTKFKFSDTIIDPPY